MNLSDMNFKDIKPGLEVISAIGTPGVVTECIAELRGNNVRYDTINLEWSNGKLSTVFHIQADKITVKE